MDDKNLKSRLKQIAKTHRDAINTKDLGKKNMLDIQYHLGYAHAAEEILNMIEDNDEQKN